MNELNAVSQIVGPSLATPNQKTDQTPVADFSDMLHKAFQQVDQQQKESERLTQQLITGEVDDLHQVMIASQKANVALQLTVQVRNKVVDAYQEMMRMQV